MIFGLSDLTAMLAVPTHSVLEWQLARQCVDAGHKTPERTGQRTRYFTALMDLDKNLLEPGGQL